MADHEAIVLFVVFFYSSCDLDLVFDSDITAVNQIIEL